MSHRLKTNDLIRTIENYRCAYISKKFPDRNIDNRYYPLVRYDHSIIYGKLIYSVWLDDNWVSFPSKGKFLFQPTEVENSCFKHENLNEALKRLLEFCRLPFVDDFSFEKI